MANHQKPPFEKLQYTLSGYKVSTMSHQAAPTPHYRQPSPLCMAAEPSPIFGRELKYGSINIPMSKSKGKTYMVKEP
jgi:hypothetical protein